MLLSNTGQCHQGVKVGMAVGTVVCSQAGAGAGAGMSHGQRGAGDLAAHLLQGCGAHTSASPSCLLGEL